MKKIALLVLIFCFFSVQTYSQINVSGTISINTTWTIENSPYNIVGDLSIKGATLTIEDGVEIIFNNRFTNALALTVILVISHIRICPYI